jgi:glycosyltransferase involved in cell wall biosynthesis
MNVINPILAVIIPARNEEKYIGKLLDSIIAATYPKHLLRVLICDGKSDDKTVEIVNQYSKDHSWISLLLNENKTTPYAFNLGIKNSGDADILITLGAHAEVYPDFFESIIKTFEISNDIGCVGGVSQNVYEDDISKCIGLAMSSSFGVGNAHFRTGNSEGYVDTVSFPAYKKEVFEKVGLFNESLTRNQDDEFNYRVAKAGFKIYLSKSIRSKYFVRGSFNKLAKQYSQYGYWKVYVNKLHKTVTSTRQLIPPAFVLFLFFGLIISCCSWFLAGFYCGILAVYFLSAYLFAAKLSNNFFEVSKVVWCFLILHCSYGYGYLKGILDFTLLGKKPGNKATEITR